MVTLPIAVVVQLAIAHAPQVAPETVAAFAKAESNLNPFAIYDNTAGKSLAAATAKDAADLARSLLDRGHSIDTGLMQINSANFARTGLDAESAFDPAKSIAAGAKIMVEAYQWCEARYKDADPLRCMASVYNTGKPTAGERNGYVGRIYAAADHVVPAIRQAGEREPTVSVRSRRPDILVLVRSLAGNPASHIFKLKRLHPDHEIARRWGEIHRLTGTLDDSTTTLAQKCLPSDGASS